MVQLLLHHQRINPLDSTGMSPLGCKSPADYLRYSTSIQHCTVVVRKNNYRYRYPPSPYAQNRRIPITYQHWDAYEHRFPSRHGPAPATAASSSRIHPQSRLSTQYLQRWIEGFLGQSSRLCSEQAARTPIKYCKSQGLGKFTHSPRAVSTPRSQHSHHQVMHA